MRALLCFNIRSPAHSSHIHSFQFTTLHNNTTCIPVRTNNQLVRVHNNEHWISSWHIGLREVYRGAPDVQITHRLGLGRPITCLWSCPWYLHNILFYFILLLTLVVSFSVFSRFAFHLKWFSHYHHNTFSDHLLHIHSSIEGKNHREFSSGRQQDASEYFMHFLEVMARSENSSLKKFDRQVFIINTSYRTAPSRTVLYRTSEVFLKINCLSYSCTERYLWWHSPL